MGKRHYTPAELCQMAKNVVKNRRICAVSPFSKMAVFCSHILWKTEGWQKVKLNRYNERVLYYWNLYDSDATQWDIQQQRLIDFAGNELNIYIETYDKSHITQPFKKNSFLYNLQWEELDNTNIMIEQYLRYLLCHFNTLIDFKMSKKKILHNRDLVQQCIDMPDDNGEKFMEMRQELIDELGYKVDLCKIEAKH